MKVLDFGLAKAMEPAADVAELTRVAHDHDAAMTRRGSFWHCGLHGPEQARGKPVDKRADIWAFGCVLYEC